MAIRRFSFLLALLSLFLPLVVAASSTSSSPTTQGSSSQGTASATVLIQGSTTSSSSVTSSAPDVSTLSIVTVVAFDIDISETSPNFALCWYPVSGNYGRSLRILFYATLAFACIARKREWLIGGALAAALTYSGAAAIHACLLIWRGPAYGETDFWALLAILSTSCIVAVPMISWSHTLRNLGATHERDSSSRTILVWWGLLVSVGFTCCFVALRLHNGSFTFYQYSPLTSVRCIPAHGQLNYTAGQDASWDLGGSIVINDEFIQENVCLDPCRGHPYPHGGALFRSDDDYRLFTAADFSLLDNFQVASSGQARTENQQHTRLFQVYINYGLLLLLYILLQGIWAVLSGRRSPEVVRNCIYEWGCSTKAPYRTPDGAEGQKRTRAQMLRRWVGKYLSLMLYLYAVFATVLCAPLLVANIIATEYWIYHIPVSETINHVGAWAPLAVTGLIMFAVIVDHVQGHVWKNIEKIWTEAKARPLHFPHEMGRRWRGMRKKRLADDEKGTRPGLEESHRKKSSGPYPKIVRKTGWSALKTLVGPFNEVRDHINILVNWIEKEWFYFIVFCKDPENRVVQFVARHRINYHEKWKETRKNQESMSKPPSTQPNDEYIPLDTNPNQDDPAPTTTLLASPVWTNPSLMTFPEADPTAQATDSADITESARPPLPRVPPAHDCGSFLALNADRRRHPPGRSTLPYPTLDSDSEHQSLVSPANRTRTRFPTRTAFSPSSTNPSSSHHPHSAASSPHLSPFSTSSPPRGAGGYAPIPSSAAVSPSLTTDPEMQRLLSPERSPSLCTTDAGEHQPGPCDGDWMRGGVAGESGLGLLEEGGMRSCNDQI